jgi:ACS family glucarate transporter-like MFS transporter
MCSVKTKQDFVTSMHPGTPSRVRWVLVGWVALMGAVSYLDRVNISIAGHTLALDYHLNNLQLGYVFSAFALGYAAFQIAGGWAADRFGARRVLTGGALWWGVFTSLTALVPHGFARALLLFWLVRFFLGVGESVMYPSSNRWVANWIPNRERGLANGVIFAGVGAGAAFTPPLIASIMIRYGWRSSFWLCAIVGVAAGLGWYLLARDRPEEHRAVNDAELDLIRAGIQIGDTERGARLPWRVMFASKDVWSITLSYFCFGYVAYIFFTWFFTYLTVVRKLNLRTGSYYTMLPFIAMSVCSGLGGLISDAVCRRSGRRWGRCGVAAAGLGLAAVFVGFGSRANSAATASVILAGGAGALYIAQSAYWALSADLGGRSAGALSGFMNMGAQSASAVSATLTPWVAERFGWTASFYIAAGMCALGALAWLFVNPDRSLADQAESHGAQQR